MNAREERRKRDMWARRYGSGFNLNVSAERLGFRIDRPIEQSYVIVQQPVETEVDAQ